MPQGDRERRTDAQAPTARTAPIGTARRREVHDPAVDAELELVSRLAAAVATRTERLSREELDEILLP